MHFVERCCPICNGYDQKFILTDINRREGLHVSSNVVECQSCSMHYLSPSPDKASLSQLYSDGVLGPVLTDFGKMHSLSAPCPKRNFLRDLTHFINGLFRGHPHDWPDKEGNGRSILDFGCDDGSKLTYWYHRGWEVAGIDLNKQAIQVAKRRLPDGLFWCGDLLDLKIDKRFDFIRADNVFEHLLNPLAYLEALSKLLKPGGQLRAFIPNGGAISTKLFGKYSAVYWMPFHLNLFTQSNLKKLLNLAGFENVRCSSYTPIGSWTWTQRQLLFKPGFDRRSPAFMDMMIQRISMFNYPGETLAQWIGLGEELFATGERSSR
jgi:SAM-dependent methyltransferase